MGYHSITPTLRVLEVWFVMSVHDVHPIHDDSITLVYWKVSCLPVKVASIDCGAVSISQKPGPLHNAIHECSCLLSLSKQRKDWYRRCGSVTNPQRWTAPEFKPWRWSWLAQRRLQSWQVTGQSRASHQCCSWSSSLQIDRGLGSLHRCGC